MPQHPFYPDARYGIKGELHWTGYKAFFTETCEEDSPHLITQVSSSPATTQDRSATTAIQADLKHKDLLPAEHLVDAGFLDAGLLVSSQQEHATELPGPFSRSSSWQARAGNGFDASQFTVDWQARQATCPQGRKSRYWSTQRNAWGNELIRIGFARWDCQPCPCRASCTRSKTGQRTVTIVPQANYEALRYARERQKTEAFQERYKLRAGIEATISQGVRACDLRHSRYLGLAKTHLYNLLVATALNVLRITAWLQGVPLAQTRRSTFVRLMEPLRKAQIAPATA